MAKNKDVSIIDFWKVTNEAHMKVKKWPEWKRNVRVTKYSVGFKGESSKSISNDSKEPSK